MSKTLAIAERILMCGLKYELDLMFHSKYIGRNIFVSCWLISGVRSNKMDKMKRILQFSILYKPNSFKEKLDKNNFVQSINLKSLLLFSSDGVYHMEAKFLTNLWIIQRPSINGGYTENENCCLFICWRHNKKTAVDIWNTVSDSDFNWNILLCLDSSKRQLVYRIWLASWPWQLSSIHCALPGTPVLQAIFINKHAPFQSQL